MCTVTSILFLLVLLALGFSSILAFVCPIKDFILNFNSPELASVEEGLLFTNKSIYVYFLFFVLITSAAQAKMLSTKIITYFGGGD